MRPQPDAGRAAPGLAAAGGLGMLLAALVALSGCSKADTPPPTGGTPAAPGKPPNGAALFDTHCSRCHGPGGRGSDQGPPLVHRIYEPSHHPDAAFYQAVAHGVRAHHWHFGDMPRIGGLSDAEVTAIIDYVRARQREAGIR